MTKNKWVTLDECDDLDQFRRFRLLTKKLWFLSDEVYESVEEVIYDLICYECSHPLISPYCDCHNSSSRYADIYNDGAEFE